MNISLSTVNQIDRNMDQQNRYVKEILDLIDECEKGELLEDISETEIKQLREHCGDIAMAANTAKKLCKNIKPLAEEEDKKKKAEEEAKKKAEEAEKKKAAAEKKKAEKEKKKAEETAKTEEAAPVETDDEEEMDFLG